MANTRIIGFYSGEEPDHRGRYLHEIQVWPDDQLEAVHDFIQWLFPLPEPSGFNAAAPILNRESMQEFRKRPELHQNLRVSFLRMMKFYGLEVDFAEQIKVTRTRYFAAKATVWLSPESQLSADHENPEVLEPSRTGGGSKSLLRMSV